MGTTGEAMHETNYTFSSAKLHGERWPLIRLVLLDKLDKMEVALAVM